MGDPTHGDCDAPKAWRRPIRRSLRSHLEKVQYARRRENFTRGHDGAEGISGGGRHHEGDAPSQSHQSPGGVHAGAPVLHCHGVYAEWEFVGLSPEERVTSATHRSDADLHCCTSIFGHGVFGRTPIYPPGSGGAELFGRGQPFDQSRGFRAGSVGFFSSVIVLNFDQTNRLLFNSHF